MDVLPNEEEGLLRRSIRQFLDEQCPTQLVREMESDPVGYPPHLWRQMADLGWFGMPLPEEYGGAGGSLIETGILLSELGRALAPVPLLSTLVPALAIARAGTPDLRQQLLPEVAKGNLIMTWAFNERSPRLTPAAIQTTAASEGDGFVLNGEKMFVENWGAAKKCLVACRTKAGSDADGISLFVIDTDSAGLTATTLTTLAKDKQSAVTFTDLRVSKANLVGDLHNGWRLVEDLLQRATALLCAQVLGAARKAMEIAVEWSKYRFAFGRPIASFQSLSHMLVDMLIAVDGAELLTYDALWRLDQGLPAEVDVSAAKAFTNERCLSIFRGANVVHGGLSFMKEFDLNLWFRKGSAWTMKLGTALEHRSVVAEGILN